MVNSEIQRLLVREKSATPNTHFHSNQLSGPSWSVVSKLECQNQSAKMAFYHCAKKGEGERWIVGGPCLVNKWFVCFFLLFTLFDFSALSFSVFRRSRFYAWTQTRLVSEVFPNLLEESLFLEIFILGLFYFSHKIIFCILNFKIFSHLGNS